MPLLFLPYP
ncbi:hypothetical protein NP493_126g10014 [Ridgeia piscesae]|uniref:Uncharacterized protein n=1 Tax=Ridgeia piscesae TaxID=27915 RepID=A0AAD9UF90_RIDPI|nr:hypothetical protein NP493_1070g00015 [Ridgeia piscesae]KAK2181476.1 hypothetical protein NP493_388g02040 [Ridgeia piscesae]KAK2187308.1 hypothetical protein NP493_170g03011 [Ridgeia piscesae]KAK2188678.1 hypothetical protein NP493_126g10014 [Ridgeia piscesae]